MPPSCTMRKRLARVLANVSSGTLRMRKSAGQDNAYSRHVAEATDERVCNEA